MNGPERPGRGEHRARLADLIAWHVERGRPAPCTVEPDAGFIAETEEDQAFAARLCRRCAVLADCAGFGAAYPREWGVYGGTTNAHRRSTSVRAAVAS